MREKLYSSSYPKRLLAGMVLSAVAITGCNSAKHSTADRIVPASKGSDEVLQDKAEQLWVNALDELRQKVSNKDKVSLLVAKGVCLYWPAALHGVDTVVRNPAIYNYVHGSETIDFVPFIPSVPKNEQLTVMNGPYTYSDSAKKIENYGNMGAVVFQNDFELFLQVKSEFELKQVVQPTPYTPGWLEATDGTKVSETELIEDVNLRKVFGGSCHLEPATESA